MGGMNKTPTPAVAILTAQVALDSHAIQLLPAGAFRASDGRPYECPAWRLDDAVAALVIRRRAERANECVIDYEHQTLNTERNGQPAPAAGWFKTLEFRPDAGLFATDVRWTASARAMIQAEEYRYISAVFRYDSATGDVLDILHAALTNNPALDGMAAVAAARFNPTEPPKETPPMELKALLALLSLPPDASEQTIKEAVTALSTAQREVAALKAAKPDPAHYVPVSAVTELQAQIAALTASVNGNQVETLIEKAMGEGRLLPALEGWARELGKKDIASLRAFVEKQPVIPALTNNQTGGKPPANTPADQLSPDELAICRQLGISNDEYLKSKGTK